MTSKWAVLDSEFEYKGETEKVFEPHSAQLDIMEDDSRFKVMPCGRRFGKSNMEAHELIPEVFRAHKMQHWLKDEGKRLEFWIVGPEYADSEKAFRVFWDKCVKLGLPMDKPGSYNNVETGGMSVSLWNGAFILHAKSENRPNSLVGEGLSGVIFDEAAKMKEITWQQLIQPTLNDFGGWALFTSTPEGKNWFYKLYTDSIKEANKAWGGFRRPSWHNYHVYTKTGRAIAIGEKAKNTPIPENEITIDSHVKRMMHIMAERPELTPFDIAPQFGLQIDEAILQSANDLPIAMFQQEMAADFTDFVGKVFKDFDEETHVRHLPFNPNWETIGAVDYGYRNPNVWLLIQIGPYGEINIIDELYQRDLAPDEFAREILRRGLCPELCTEFYPDPASPGDTAILENLFRRAGKRAKAKAHTGGELNNRLNLIRLALRNRLIDTEKSQDQWRSHPTQPDKLRPQLMVSDRCPKTIFEMAEYRYPKEKSEQVETSTKRFDLPMKKDDHTPEALGRFLAGKYHSAAAQYGGGTRITKAQFLQGLGSKRYDHPGGYGDQPAGISQESLPRKRGTWNGR
jgi:hypothetical protein